MPKLMLMGGEKDGLEIAIRVAADRPDIFYAVPNVDDEKIRKIKGTTNKLELRDKLAILAYEFDPEASDDETFRMKRTPDKDKVRST
jgi:hypothetical protein